MYILCLCPHASQRNRSRLLKSTPGPCTRCPVPTPGCWPPLAPSARSAFPLWPRRIFQLKQRQRGFDEAQYLEAIVLLQTAGGDCPEDMQLLGNDPCLERGLGFPLPKVSAVRGFLERFHDEALENPALRARCRRVSSCPAVRRWRDCRRCKPAWCAASPSSTPSSKPPCASPR